VTSAAIKVLAPVVVGIFIVVVGIVAVIVQRKFGWKWLWVVWLTPAVVYTGFLLTQVDYNVHSIISRPVLSFATANFVLMSVFSGMVVWHTSVWFGPRPPSAASDGMGGLPLTVPAGHVENAHGLTSILRRYHALLAMYTTALEAAGRFNPYPSVWRFFLEVFRGFLPSSIRQSRERLRQMSQVPNVLGMDFISAENILVELETLTIAELSAIEECHRINVRHLRQRSIFGWKSQLAVLITAVTGVVLAAERVGVLKLKDIDVWHLMSGITMMGTDMPSSIFRAVIFVFVFVLMRFISDGTRYLPILQRLRAFEDILTIAKAYRKEHAETIELKAQKGSTDDPESMWK
jgi:hypothetical protein